MTARPAPLTPEQRVQAFLDNNAQQYGIDHETLAHNAVDGVDAKILRSDLVALLATRAQLAAVTLERDRAIESNATRHRDMQAVIAELRNYELNGSDAPAQIRALYSDGDETSNRMRHFLAAVRAFCANEQEWGEAFNSLKDNGPHWPAATLVENISALESSVYAALSAARAALSPTQPTPTEGNES